MNIKLKNKAIGRVLILIVMMLMPLTEADANYYYKVRLVDNDGNNVNFKIDNNDSEWSDWIYNEAQLNEKGEVYDWKNSLRKLVERQTVKDRSGNDVFLYDTDGNKIRTVYGIAFKGERVMGGKGWYYQILDGDDFKYTDKDGEHDTFQSIKSDIIELDLSEWGKSFYRGEFYFAGMENLKKVKLPNNDFAIRDRNLFSGCYNLEELIWGEKTKITEIGEAAFRDCYNLPMEYIQRMIEECAANSNNIKERNEKYISLTDESEKKEHIALYGDPQYSFPGVICKEAFFNCMQLGGDEHTLTITNGINTIGYAAFCQNRNNTRLRTVKFKGEGAIKIDERAFDGCKTLTDVLLGDVKITHLGAGAFKNNRTITSPSVNSIIANYAQNSSTKDVDGNVAIAGRIFEGCNGLLYDDPADGYPETSRVNFTELVIPSNVSEIGECAFGSWETTPFLKTITVSSKKAPKCKKGSSDVNNNTVFNGLTPNEVTVIFDGEAKEYDTEGNTNGYKSYMAEVTDEGCDAEFRRLLTKDIYSDVTDKATSGYSNSYKYEVVPQQHAIVRLHRKLKEGWNTLCLPFGATEAAAKVGADVKNCSIMKNALNKSGDDNFMIAVYRDYVPSTNTFRFLRIYDDNANDLNKYIGAEMAAYEPFMVKMADGDINTDNIYTFTNVDLNYDYSTGSAVISNAKEGNIPVPLKFAGKAEDNFPAGGTTGQYVFTGTFTTFEGIVGSSEDEDLTVNNSLTTSDYYIQTKDGVTHSYQYKEGNKVRVKAFSGWFHRKKESLGAKPVSILVDIVDENNETTDIVNISPNDSNSITAGNIYNMNGQLMRINVSDIDDLPKGIYVANGKKFILK